MKVQQILIIEDDISLNKGLCQALSSEDRQIFSCTNLQAARQQLACFKASLILLDITLPDGSGLDFLVEVKTDFPDIPVILLTANDTDFDIVSGGVTVINGGTGTAVNVNPSSNSNSAKSESTEETKESTDNTESLLQKILVPTVIVFAAVIAVVCIIVAIKRGKNNSK